MSVNEPSQSDYHGPMRRAGEPDWHRTNGGASLSTRFGSLALWGRWGAVLALVALAAIATSGVFAYALWTFNENLKANLAQMRTEHQQLIDWQRQTAEVQANAVCVQAILDPVERIAAYRSGSPCYYAENVYVPKGSTEPRIVVVPLSPTPGVPHAAPPPLPKVTPPPVPAVPKSFTGGTR